MLTLVNKTEPRGLRELLKMKPKQDLKIDLSANTKKVYFGDNGEVVDKPIVKSKPAKAVETENQESTEVDYEKPKKNFKKYHDNGDNLETRWYQIHDEHNTSEFKDIKDSELNTLQTLCRNSFNEEIQKLSKSKWKESSRVRLFNLCIFR